MEPTKQQHVLQAWSQHATTHMLLGGTPAVKPLRSCATVRSHQSVDCAIAQQHERNTRRGRQHAENALLAFTHMKRTPPTTTTSEAPLLAAHQQAFEHNHDHDY